LPPPLQLLRRRNKMKQTIFYSVAIIGIASLVYLNFFKSKKMDAPVEVVSTDSAPQPIGPYSQAIRKGNALFVSGQVGINPANGKPDTTDIASETKCALDNVKAILKASRLSMNDIAKTTIYLTDLQNFKTVNDIYATYFGEGPFPARETVGVAALPKGMHIEISVVAIK
jgi:2-iminobutanoate/2-iminopropanoate deaminase